MEKVFSRDGTPIAFDRTGGGPPIILVDGALCYRASGPMGPLAALLAPHFTVIAYDRRGRGDSGDTAPYSVEREVEDVAALIDAAGGSAFVYGVSSGAALALEAADRGLAIKKLALYEEPFIVDGSRPALPEDFLAQLHERLPAGRWSSVTVPTLVMDGGKSPAWIRHAMQALTTVLPNAKLRTLERQTHMVSPKALAPALVEFYRGT